MYYPIAVKDGVVISHGFGVSSLDAAVTEAVWEKEYLAEPADGVVSGVIFLSSLIDLVTIERMVGRPVEARCYNRGIPVFVRK